MYSGYKSCDTRIQDTEADTVDYLGSPGRHLSQPGTVSRQDYCSHKFDPPQYRLWRASIRGMGTDRDTLPGNIRPRTVMAELRHGDNL